MKSIFKTLQFMFIGLSIGMTLSAFLLADQNWLLMSSLCQIALFILLILEDVKIISKLNNIEERLDKCKIAEFSDPGFNFKGKKLTEDNFPSDILVMHNKAFYVTGNRRGTQVELCNVNEHYFIETVSMDEIQLVRYK